MVVRLKKRVVEAVENMIEPSIKDCPYPIEVCGCGKPLEPFYVQGVGGLLRGGWKPAPEMCEECRKKRDQRISLINRQNVLERAFKNSGITPRGRERTLKNFKVTATNRTAFETAVQFTVAKELPRRGMFIFAANGRGKTHLAQAIANRCVRRRLSVLFIALADFFLELQGGFRNDEADEIVKRAREVDILILDDLGSKKPTEWVLEILFLIINYRYEYRLPIVVTSDISFQEISERYHDRISSRLYGMCERVKIEDPEDWRCK